MFIENNVITIESKEEAELLQNSLEEAIAVMQKNDLKKSINEKEIAVSKQLSKALDNIIKYMCI